MQVKAVNAGTYKGISYLHGNILHIDDGDFDASWMEALEAREPVPAPVESAEQKGEANV